MQSYGSQRLSCAGWSGPKVEALAVEADSSDGGVTAGQSRAVGGPDQAIATASHPEGERHDPRYTTSELSVHSELDPDQ